MMNGFIVIAVGLLIAAFGSFVTLYGGHLNSRFASGRRPTSGGAASGYVVMVVGLLIAAMGTCLAYYGAELNNRKDSQALEKKINVTLAKLEDAKTEPSSKGSSGPNAAKVQQIEDEFSNWATQFLLTRDARRLELDKTQLNRRSAEARISDKWRPFVVQFISILQRTVDAYNAKAGSKIKVNLPVVSANLYEQEYKGEISFDAEHVWRISAFTERPAREREAPALFVEFANEKAPFTAASRIGVNFHPDDNTFTISSRGRPPIDIDIGSTSVTQFERIATETIRKLFEAQILEQPASSEK
jgi:hypothetical protein